VLTYIANRGDEFEVRFLKTMFDLGRTRFVFYCPNDRDSMAEVIADADIVINMIGRKYDTKAPSNIDKFPYLELKTNFSMEQAHVDIPRTIAELCTEMQVDNLIHVSAMAASPDSKSEWARTKYAGEMAVREAYPWATIIKPTQIFGPEDKLLNWYALAASGTYLFPFVPFWDGGDTLTQPVYMNDVATTITRIVDDPEKFEGKTVDCFGAQDFTYTELAEFVYDITSQLPRKVNLPMNVAQTMGKIYGSKLKPDFTADMVDLWTEDCVARMTPEEYKAQTDFLTMENLGVKQTPIEKVAFNWLHRFRQGGHFVLTGGYHGHETVTK